MAGIDFEGLNVQSAMLGGSISEGQTFFSPLQKLALDSRVAWRYENAERRLRFGRVANSAVDGLEQRVEKFEAALAAFAWPKENSFNRARLVVPTLDSEDSAEDPTTKVDASIQSEEEATRYYKYFSRGRERGADTGLDGDSYSFAVTVGGETEEATVDIESGADWEDIVTQVADAINSLNLAIQAEVIHQNAPGQMLEGLNKTGSILAVTVNPAYEAQDVSFANTDGHLLNALDLTATDLPILPATKTMYNIDIASRARPTTIQSGVFNPVETTTLDAGTHRFSYSIGGVSDTVSVYIEDGQTWEDVLSSVASEINASSSKMYAEVKEGVRPSSLADDPLLAKGQYIELTLASPKLGERLTLGEYGGPVLADVDGFYNPTSVLPNWVTGGERYIASATANGWVKDRIYEYDGAAWNETTPAAYNSVTNADDGLDYFYDGTSWSTTPSGTLLEDLGMTGVAYSGSDASITVNGGRPVASETGAFTVDKGRVRIDVKESFGDDLPLSVVDGFSQVEEQFADVVTAYNDLRTYLLSHQDLFEDGFAEKWRAPYESRKDDLAAFGVEEVTGKKLLGVDADAFWQRILSNPDEAKATLAGAFGLVRDWQQTSYKLRSPSLHDRLVPESALEDTGPPVAEEFDLKKRATLQQVLSSLATVPEASTNPYLEATGILQDIVEAKRSSLSQTPPELGSGGILDADG